MDSSLNLGSDRSSSPQDAIRDGAQSTLARRLLRLADLKTVKAPAAKRAILTVALLIFVTGLVLSLRAHPNALTDLRWQPIALLVLLAVPITILLNAIEFALVAGMVKQKVALGRATEITILVSAANLLPLPGGALVRIMALKAGGARYSRGTVATLLAALIWIGVSLLYGGIWIVATTPGWLGTSLSITAGLCLGASAIVALQQRFYGPVTLGVLATRLILVVVDAWRLYLCLLALGADATFAQGSAFAAASAAGSAVSLVPGGLGIREAVTAMMAPAVGVAAAIGFLAATLNRLAGFPVLILLALLFTWRGGRKRTSDQVVEARGVG